MPNTPRTQIPYPRENQDPFYDAFEGMVLDIDTKVYAARENAHILLMDGGTFAFQVDGGSNLATLSWNGNINITAATTGFIWYVAPGNVTLSDGEFLYLQVPRAPVENTALAFLHGPQVPASDDIVLVGVRKGALLYFRNGRSIKHGESTSVLASSTASSGGGTTPEYKQPCRVATTENVALATGAPTEVDGVTLEVNQRVIVWKQTDLTENGIYTVQSLGTGHNGTWVRAEDAATSADFKAGMLVVSTEGTDTPDKLFELASNDPIVLGTSEIVWVIAGTNLATSAPVMIHAGDSGAVGTSTKTAREDHKHAVSTGGLSDIQTIDGAAAQAGSSNSLARADHKHAVSYGTIDGTICNGGDARIPTSDENAALQGTSGTPSDSNRYVTDADARNSNDRVATGIRILDGSSVATTSSAIPQAGMALVGNSSAQCGFQFVNHTTLLNKGTYTHSEIDSYLPTSDQKAALAGTKNTPSNTNRYVTSDDSRLSDVRVANALVVNSDHTILNLTNNGTSPSSGDVLVASDEENAEFRKLNAPLVFTFSGLTGTTATTQYYLAPGFDHSTPNASETFAIVPADATINKFYAYLPTPITGTGTCLVTLRLNGTVVSTLTFESGISFMNVTNLTTVVSAGSRLSIGIKNSGTVTVAYDRPTVSVLLSTNCF